MSSKLDDLYRLQKKDILQAAAVLTDAFQHDPVWNAVLGDATPAQRVGAFETPVRYCLKYGEAYAVSPALEGIAAWMPGHLAEMTFWRLLRSGALGAGMKLGMTIGRKMEPIFRPLDVDRKAIMQGQPFTYLQIIGVAQAAQGQGVGGKLLRALIENSEQASLPLYLETETESNVQMYEHFGFEVVKKITLPIINLPMWEMTRRV